MEHNKLRIAVLGASGYSGAELVRLLLPHPGCGELCLFSSSLQSDSCDYAEFHAAFYGCNLRVYKLPEWQELFASFDVIFLATPHSVSVELARHYFSQGEKRAKVIDLSGALRLDDPQLFQKWYAEETLSAEQLKCCQYGLSELFAESICRAQVIANPGCYATATILALAPLAQQNLLGRVRIDAKSGVSGAGKKASSGSHFVAANESLSLYKIHQHQHIPEVEMALEKLGGRAVQPLTFNTHLLPITRGIMATCYIELLEDCRDLHRLYSDFYRAAHFVRVRPQNGEAGEKLGIPQIQDVSFSNRCDIGLRRNERNGELVVVAVLDNLLKGASGQAVQNMNLVFGFEETAGLPAVASLP